MSRVALLIGVSQNDRAPLPPAWKNVEVMRRALRQAHPPFDAIVCLRDRPQRELATAVEAFFRQRQRDDLVLCFFSGYGGVTAQGRGYFLMADTAAVEADDLSKAQMLSASFLQDVMDSSPARQQIVVLDCHWRPLDGEAERSLNLDGQLGGPGRVILAASVTMHRGPELDDLDAWSYTRYWAEGLSTGVADLDLDGDMTAEELHLYARQKLQVAAPALQPAIAGSMETASIPIADVPPDEAALSYRRFLEKLTVRCDVDETGLRLETGRHWLEPLRRHLGLSPRQADAIEAQVLRPVREYRQRLQLYRERVGQVAEAEFGENPDAIAVAPVDEPPAEREAEVQDSRTPQPEDSRRAAVPKPTPPPTTAAQTLIQSPEDPGAEGDRTPTPAAAPSELDRITHQLDGLQRQYDALVAEFERWQAQAHQEHRELEQTVQREMLRALLLVVDSFDRARSRLQRVTPKESNLHDDYLQVYRQLVVCLQQMGVVPMAVEGEQVDPQRHEVVLEDKTGRYPNGSVLEEVRRGYFLGDQVLRRAQVKVAATPEAVIASEADRS